MKHGEVLPTRKNPWKNSQLFLAAYDDNQSTLRNLDEANKVKDTPIDSFSYQSFQSFSSKYKNTQKLWWTNQNVLSVFFWDTDLSEVDDPVSKRFHNQNQSNSEKSPNHTTTILQENIFDINTILTFSQGLVKNNDN